MVRSRRGVSAAPARRRGFAAAVAVGLAAVVTIPVSAGAETAPADGGRHVAIVIGNGRFGDDLSSPQPAADAAAVAERLQARGFALIALGPRNKCAEGGPAVDVNREAMRAIIACLAAAARGARQAVVYFSGYSVAVGGANYLLPAATARHARATAAGSAGLVDLQSVLEALEQAQPGAAIVIVDAARRAVRDFPGAEPGLAAVAATTHPRLLAYASPLGEWADDNEDAKVPQTGPDTAGDRPQQGSPKEQALSPYTRRLVRLLDDDLDERSLNGRGLDVAALFRQASFAGGPNSGRLATVTAENFSDAGMLGVLPRIGSSDCEFLTWRASNVGRCIEVAAAYDHCGRDAAMRERLKNRCAADWAALVREELMASLAGAMKTKTCSSLREVVTKFGAEPAAQALDEFREAGSLAQYTCAARQEPDQAPRKPVTVVRNPKPRHTKATPVPQSPLVAPDGPR